MHLQLKQFVANDVHRLSCWCERYGFSQGITLMKNVQDKIIISSIQPSETDNKLYVLSNDGMLSVFPKHNISQNLAKQCIQLRTNDPIVYIDTEVDTGTVTIKEFLIRLQ